MSRLLLAVWTLMMLGVNSVKANELSPSDAAVIMSIEKMISATRVDFVNHRYNLSPTKPESHGISVEIEGEDKFSSLLESVHLNCEKIRDYLPESYVCTKEVSVEGEDLGLDLYFRRLSDNFKLESGLVYIKPRLIK